MITKEFKFKNGDLVKEKITGFVGTIVGSVYYLTGCNQYLVTAKAESRFKEAVSIWYDEGRLEYSGVSVQEDEVKANKNGSDMAAPIK